MKAIDQTTYTTLTVSATAPSVGFFFGPSDGGSGPGSGGGSPGGMGAEDITPAPTSQDELDALICNIYRS